MSSRCTIAYHGPIHIYECVNTYDKNGNFEICIADIDYWNKDSYNNDVVLGRKCLFQVYQSLEKYFTPDLREIEKMGFNIDEVQKAIQLFKDIENKAEEKKELDKNE